MLRLTIGSGMLRLSSCMLRLGLRLSIGSCMLRLGLRLRLSFRGSGGHVEPEQADLGYTSGSCVGRHPSNSWPNLTSPNFNMLTLSEFGGGGGAAIQAGGEFPPHTAAAVGLRPMGGVNPMRRRFLFGGINPPRARFRTCPYRL